LKPDDENRQNSGVIILQLPANHCAVQAEESDGPAIYLALADSDC
jgi:hypothetical protein